jgi:imidazolonepropionase-like amidohydrolase
MDRRFLTSGLLAAWVMAAPMAAAQQNERVIRAAAFVNPKGEIQRGATILIREGRIVSISEGEAAPDGAAIDDYPQAVVCPGLIDIQAALGAFGQLGERADAMEPAVNARDAFDAHHRELRAALRAGVTSFALVPDDSDLIGGRAAICKTSGPEGRPYVLSDAGPMKLSLSPDMMLGDRNPTSRGGALGILRRELEAAAAEKPGTTQAGGKPSNPLSQLVRGEFPLVCAAPSGADVLSLLGVMKPYKTRLIFAHQQDARVVAETMAKAGAAAIIGPFDLSEPVRTATAGAIYGNNEVTTAIAGGLPEAPADSLRLGAAVAARNGMSLPAARRAITATPAELLGVADRIGSIQAGRDADLVLFSGDPLDLRSRVLAVYVDGRRVWSAGDSEQ